MEELFIVPFDNRVEPIEEGLLLAIVAAVMVKDDAIIFDSISNMLMETDEEDTLAYESEYNTLISQTDYAYPRLAQIVHELLPDNVRENGYVSDVTGFIDSLILHFEVST